VGHARERANTRGQIQAAFQKRKLQARFSCFTGADGDRINRRPCRRIACMARSYRLALALV
jgi:hypothetical protein